MVSGMREMEQDEIELKDISAREVRGVLHWLKTPSQTTIYPVWYFFSRACMIDALVLSGVEANYRDVAFVISH